MKRLKKQLGPNAVIDTEYDHKPLRPRQSLFIKGIVCERRCNNGWMRELENEAIPILSPMLLGRSQTLNSAAQLTLATWAVLRAVIFDCFRAPRFYESRETSHLLDHVTPPHSTFGVWLGYCIDGLAFTDGKTLVTADGRREGYVNTMVFGHLMLQVLTIRKTQTQPVASITVDMVSGPWEEALIPIWPLSLRPVDWPPPKLGFDPHANGLHFLADRFSTGRR